MLIRAAMLKHLLPAGVQPRMLEAESWYDHGLTFPEENAPAPDSPLPDRSKLYMRLRSAVDAVGLSDPTTLEYLYNQVKEQARPPHHIAASRQGAARAVRDVLGQMQHELVPLPDGLEDALSIHMEQVLCRANGGMSVRNDALQRIEQKYPEEYALAQEFVERFGTCAHCTVPQQELPMLTLYLHAFAVRKRTRRIRVLLMTHGQIGVAMAQVVNHMLRDDNAIGFSVGWEESNEQALERAIQTVQQADEGLGCLLLVDMGSLASFAPEIAQRTGVEVRCVARVDTLMALDAVRRINLQDGTSLNSLADTLEAGRLHAGFSAVENRTGKPPALLTICITGEGNASRIRSFLKATIAECEKIHIVDIGLLNRDAMQARVAEIRRDYDIVAAVGTMNPELVGVPFLSMDYVFSGHGTMALTNLLAEYCQKNTGLGNLLDPQLILCDADYEDKNDVIDQMCNLLQKHGYVSPEFLLSVYKRENLGITCLPEKIAIPHGEACYVTKPAICVAKLRRPVEWAAGNVAEFVFLFALEENCQEYIQKFYEIVKDETDIKALKSAKHPEDIYKILA